MQVQYTEAVPEFLYEIPSIEKLYEIPYSFIPCFAYSIWNKRWVNLWSLFTSLMRVVR